MIPEEKKKIVKMMSHFDCTEREGLIYLHCLKTGISTVSDVAKDLGINRITVHSAVEQLLKKGFLYETRKGKKRFIGAEDPEIFHTVFNQKKAEMDVLHASILESKQIFENIESHGHDRPGVKFYEGVGGFKKMLEETLEAKGTLRLILYVDMFSKIVTTEYFENYFLRRAEKDIMTKVIYSPCEFATHVNKQAEKYKLDVRILPPEFHWKAGVFSWNDKVAMLSLSENQLTCTIIENKDIADFYQNILFEFIFARADRIE